MRSEDGAGGLKNRCYPLDLCSEVRSLRFADGHIICGWLRLDTTETGGTAATDHDGGVEGNVREGRCG